MEITLSEFENKLAKLQRNRNQTTLEERRGKYHEVFKKFERGIAEDANEIARSFLLDGMRFSPDPADRKLKEEFVQRVNAILAQEKASGEFKRVSKVLFQTLDLDAFLNSLTERLWPRIWYEGYGPYWTKHCEPMWERDGRPQFYNKLIDMYWEDDYGLWVAQDGLAFTIMLPPTMEKIRDERERDAGVKTKTAGH